MRDIKKLEDPNLLVGFDKSDDACVYKLSDELALIQTVDFFPPIADDPYTFGQIAAVNALSDVYAMGGEPKICLNIMGVPKKMPKDVICAILKGGNDKVTEAGAIIAGGHTILDEEPKYGLSVTGFVHPDKFFKNNGAAAGDVLILTKPIGIGVLTTAAKANMLSEEVYAFAIKMMTTLNKYARDIIVKYDVHACTDVTGFGLLGHLSEMMEGSGLTAEIDGSAIEFVPEALELASMGVIAEGMYRNRSAFEHRVDASGIEEAVADLLFDPQTAGGLLFAISETDAEACLRELEPAVPAAQKIGRILPSSGEKHILIV